MAEALKIYIGHYDSPILLEDERLVKLVIDEIEEELGTKDLSIVTPTLLDRWNGAKEDAHLFINFLEKLKKMKETERQLEKIRRRKMK